MGYIDKISATITQHLKNDQFRSLDYLFTVSGRGRRPNLPSPAVGNQLLIQFDMLRTAGCCAWDELEKFIIKFLPSWYPCKKIRTLMQRTISGLEDKLQESDELVLLFLNTKLDLQHVGPHLNVVDIGRQELSDNTLSGLRQRVLKMRETDTVLSNGMVTELESFRRQDNLPHGALVQWLNVLLLSPMSEILLKKKVKKHFNEMKKRNKNIGRGCGQQELDAFLRTDFQEQCRSMPDENSRLCIDEGPQTTQSSSVSSVLQLAQKVVKIRYLTGQVEKQAKDYCELKEAMTVLKESVTVLEEIIEENKSTIKALKSYLNIRDMKIKRLKAVIDEKEDEIGKLKESKKVAYSTKKSAYYRRLKRQEQTLTEKQIIIQEHQNGGCEKKQLDLKLQLKNVQTQLSSHKRNLEENKEWINHLKNDLLPITKAKDTDQINSQILQTRVDSSNKFTPDVIRCAMELMGESEVPGNRCGRVMYIVVRHLFHLNIPLTDFPSGRTAIRISDCAHALAKHHVGEALVNSNGYDMHSDGTDRDHNKVMGYQMTTKDQGTLSVGFVGVHRENTKTLLDVAINLLKELAYVYDDKNIDEAYKTMLQNMTGLMSDRASVMKSFGYELNKIRQEVIGKVDNLEFLHCNAHFLLGLSTVAEKTLSVIEKNMDEVLGRDQLSKFATRFCNSSENATSRYIRTACDSLGPRGDEKNGCRDAWAAYCHLTEIKSYISSYRSNRFNNFFQAGVALHYHRDDINKFFLNYHPGANLKLQSVHADCKSDTIDQLLVATGILYFRVTGPYWRLIGSKTKYLDFYKYVQKMVTALRNWTVDATPLLEKEMMPLFEEFALPETEEFGALFTLPDSHRQLVKSTLEQICGQFVTVAMRQLCNFLEGGCHFDIQDSERRSKMDHCLLTNLIGEACFGDLDFSIFKRRNASLHYHSTINMLKRNKTVSVWLSDKSDEEQKHLLIESAKKAQILRESHKQMQRDVMEKRKEMLKENRDTKERKQVATLKKKQAAVQEVKGHGGPCLTPQDVDHLLNTFPTKGRKPSVLDVIKSEIRYQQLVMGISSHKLPLSRPINELVTKLKTFLAETNNSMSPNNTEGEMLSDHEETNDCQRTMPKSLLEAPNLEQEKSKRCHSNDTDDDNFKPVPAKKRLFNNTFEFECQGNTVAVVYEDEYYIGEVLEVFSKTKGNVTFMEKCALGNAYRWPSVVDIDDIDAQFVIHWDFEMFSPNGRVWSVQDKFLLDSKYKQYKKMCCS